jgi:hypothetical protein
VSFKSLCFLWIDKNKYLREKYTSMKALQGTFMDSNKLVYTFGNMLLTFNQGDTENKTRNCDFF